MLICVAIAFISTSSNHLFTNIIIGELSTIGTVSILVWNAPKTPVFVLQKIANIEVRLKIFDLFRAWAPPSIRLTTLIDVLTKKHHPWFALYTGATAQDKIVTQWHHAYKFLIGYISVTMSFRGQIYFTIVQMISDSAKTGEILIAGRRLLPFDISGTIFFHGH